MTTITHGFDGLADGTTVTTSAYGTGTAPNAVVGSVTADATRAVHGDMAGEFAVSGTSTSGIQDTTSLGTQTIVRGRAYLYLNASPAANLRIFQVLDGTTLACSVGINSSRQVRLVDSAFATMATSGTAIPTGQTVRVEWRFVASTTAGTASVKVWFSPESTGTPDITLSAGTTYNTRASFSRYDAGISFSSSQTYSLFLDEIAWTDDDSGDIGPYVAPPSEQTFTWDFEDGTVGDWDTATNVTVHGDYAKNGSYGVRLDSTTSFSRLRLDTNSFGSSRRWAAVNFWVRFPQGAPTEDLAILRWRNTDPSSSGGGGNGDIWLDSADQTLRGDLQPTDSFTHPTPLAADTWYPLQTVCAFKADGTSLLKVKLNGTEIANVTSTLNDAAQVYQFIEWGVLSTQDDILDVDDITIVMSDTELDYEPMDIPITLGRATETTTARAVTLSKTLTAGHAAETTTARTLAVSKTLTAGQTTETVTARPVTVSKSINAGRALETTTARPVSISKTLSTGQAAETVTARPVTLSKSLSAGRASETTTARPVTVQTVEGTTLALGRATESTTARTVTVSKTLTLGRAVEADAARTLTVARVIAIGRATSTTTARALTPAKTYTLGQATQTTTARAVTVTGGAAPETLPTNLGGALVSTGYGGSSVSQGYSGSLT